jgi:uncharacterized protein
LSRQPSGNVNGVTPASGWVLVTGASAGIGRELARAFASRNYDRVLAARNEVALSALARELAATHPVRARTMPVDLSLPGAAEAMADALSKARIDVGVLVNNAGILFEGAFALSSLDDCMRLLEINVVALTALTRLFLPPMLERGAGRILNVASTAAFVPVPRLSVYAAAKAYVLSLTEAIAEELRGSGVAATALCPGFTDTSMVRGSALASTIPPAMIMSPKDVAELGCAACVKGETICVPGLANKVVASGAPLLPRALVRALGGAVNGGGWRRVVSALGACGANPGGGAR